MQEAPGRLILLFALLLAPLAASADSLWPDRLVRLGDVEKLRCQKCPAPQVDGAVTRLARVDLTGCPVPGCRTQPVAGSRRIQLHGEVVSSDATD